MHEPVKSLGVLFYNCNMQYYISTLITVAVLNYEPLKQCRPTSTQGYLQCIQSSSKVQKKAWEINIKFVTDILSLCSSNNVLKYIFMFYLKITTVTMVTTAEKFISFIPVKHKHIFSIICVQCITKTYRIFIWLHWSLSISKQHCYRHTCIA